MKILLKAYSVTLILTVAAVRAQDAPVPVPPPTPPEPAPAVQTGPVDLVSTVAQTAELSSLRLAIVASGLTEALSSTGPFTLLAPSNEAFARLDRQTLASLMAPENQPALAAIIAHHVLPGRLSASDLARFASAPSLSGQRLEIRRGPSGPIIAGGSISVADIQATNGVIHIVDSVLFPTTRDIRATLEASGRFGRFVALLDALDDDELMPPGAQVTLLAPTDDAFDALSNEAVAMLKTRRNREVLRSLLENHIIPERLTVSQAIAQSPIRTAHGSILRAARDEAGHLRLQFTEKDFANILAADLDTTNGLVQVVDALIVPPAGLKLVPDGRLVVGMFLDAAGSVLASQFALDGKRALVVGGLTSGGPAQKSGVLKNDVIVSINGQIATEDELARAKAAVGYGGFIEFIIYRKGEKLTIKVPVGVER